MTDTNIPTSVVLDRAADLIEERGWSVGVMSWGGDGAKKPLCLEGGILAALGYKKGFYDGELNALEYWSCPAYLAVQQHLDCTPGLESGVPIDALWQWNDAPGRTAAEVIEVLRAAAVIEAAKERADVSEVVAR